MSIETAGQKLIGHVVSFKTHICEGTGTVETVTRGKRGEFVAVRVDNPQGRRQGIVICRPSQCQVKQ